MRKTLSRYLYILGVVQLIGLNLGGFFWLAWASGIREAKQSSRHWVIGIHSIYLVFGAFALSKWFFDPNSMTYLNVISHRVETGRLVVLIFILLFMAIYGLPILWLMSKKGKEEFIEPSVGGDGKPAPQP